MSDTPVIVQIVSDSMTVVILATIALVGRWIIFREAVALRKSLAALHEEHTDSMETILKDMAALKRQIEEIDTTG